MLRFALATAVLALALVGCTADPPPPIESTDSPKTTAAEPTKNTVVVAIDDVGIGFNPHLLADQSPTSMAVGSLVLPSPFRPVSSQARNGATDWILDPSVLISADVTSQDPFTITYQLRNEAQWSDGAPIAAEDFRYLWQQMIAAPGVVDPAGYDLIADVGSSGGGKTVTVTMNAPYPAWRELFADLLPSHLVKDSPGGFARGLAENIPVSGAHFHIKSIDRGRDEILLERNDRFWDEPAKPDQILMRRGGVPAQLADSMRSGDAQVAVVRGGSASQAQLAAIPTVRTASMYQPRILQLALNGRDGDLADVRVRSAVIGMLDPDVLAMVGANSRSAMVPARAQVLSPSDPGYLPTAPQRITAERAYALLGEAGFTHADAATATPSVAPTQVPPATAPTVTAPTSAALSPGSITKGGKALAIRIGAPENDDTAIAVANTVADQLHGSGIAATVRVLAPDELFGANLVDGDIDAVVGWVRAGSDPATALASRFGCPPAGEQNSGGPTADVSPSPAANAAPGNRAPSNLSGVCDPTLQPAIDAALRGTTDVGQVLAQAEPKLWQLSTVLPLLQDTSIAAAGAGVEGVGLAGPIQAGIFGDAAGWSRIPE